MQIGVSTTVNPQHYTYPFFHTISLTKILLTDQEEPATYTEAMEGPKSEKWLEAMKSEIRYMYDNQVWTLVDIPSNRKAIENKWIFKKKTDADDNITFYKARLVANDF
jgi:hypothetical protein